MPSVNFKPLFLSTKSLTALLLPAVAIWGLTAAATGAAAPVKKPLNKKASPAKEVDTGSAITYFNQGVSATQSNNFLQAIQYYKAARDADPNFLNAYINELTSYLSLKRPDLAVDIATKGIAICNKNDNEYKMCWELLHSGRGTAYAELKQPQKAVADYTESLIHDISQRGCIARVKRGLCYVELGEYQKAESDFNTILQSTATDNAMQNAKVLAQEGRKILQVKIKVDMVQSLRKCQELIAKKDFDKALALTNNMIALDPKNVDLLLIRCSIFTAKHLPEKADADLKLADKLSPNDGKISFVSGMNHLASGDFEKAIDDFQTAIARRYSSPQIYLSQASAQLHLCRFDDAVKSVNEAIRLSPNNAEAYNVRSLVYLVTNTPENSIADANSYLEKTSWKGSHSADCFLRIYMLSKQLNLKDSANNILETATTQLKSDEQVQRVIAFFKDGMDETTFLSAATTPLETTDAQIAVAIKAVVSGDTNKAKQVLSDMKLTGAKIAEFYLTGIVELARLMGSYTPPKIEPA